jgi:VanZ family protein
MTKEINPVLQFRLLWLIIGYTLVALVLYLSLTSSPVDLDIDIKYQDKFFHAFAYFTLMFWFAQIYHDKFWRHGYAVVFVLMGAGLEYLQSFDPERYYELADMAANTTGVVVGLLLTLTSAKNILLNIENRFK